MKIECAREQPESRNQHGSAAVQYSMTITRWEVFAVQQDPLNLAGSPPGLPMQRRPYVDVYVKVI